MSTVSVERSVFWLSTVDANVAAGLSLDRRYDSKMYVKQSLASLMASFDCGDDDDDEEVECKGGGEVHAVVNCRKVFASVATNPLVLTQRWANPDGAVSRRDSNDGIDSTILSLL